MKPALYLFVNKGLGMSTGKVSAQVAQATVGTMLVSDEDILTKWWEGPGQHHAVYVMQAEDNEHIYTIERYLNARGFKTFVMIDEGMTEIRPHTPTVLGVEVVDKEDENVEASFMAFKLYRDTKPQTKKKRWWLT